jgi:hypothetical protein
MCPGQVTISLLHFEHIIGVETLTSEVHPHIWEEVEV